ncbi:hypothetical protein MRB53_038309 [Persea americana]|nr:hypothetical protein MRB53_038309 [Persea americana]
MLLPPIKSLSPCVWQLSPTQCYVAAGLKPRSFYRPSAGMSCITAKRDHSPLWHDIACDTRGDILTWPLKFGCEAESSQEHIHQLHAQQGGGALNFRAILPLMLELHCTIAIRSKGGEREARPHCAVDAFKRHLFPLEIR